MKTGRLRPFMALLRTSFLRMLLTTFQLGNSNKKRKKAATGIGAFLFLSVLMLFISGTYSFALAAAFAPLGGLDIMLAGMALFALLFSFILTAFSAQSIVFSPSDMDLTFSLPVSSFSVILSRVLALYLEVLLMVELLLLPASIAFVWFGGAVAAIPGLLVGGLFWSLLPTLVGLVFGGLISLLVSRIRHKNLFATIFSILLFMGLFAGMGAMFSVDADPAAMDSLDLVPVRAALMDIFPPTGWLVQGATQNPLYLLLLAAVCVLPFLGLVWLFSRFYKRLLTALGSHRLDSSYKLGGLKSSSLTWALFKKEAGRLFGNAMYLLNSCVGVLMMILASGWLIFQGPSLLAQVQELGLPIELIREYIPAVIAGVALLIGVMCFPAAVSISLEGRYLWIIKEAPVGAMRLLLVKAGLNALVVFAGAVACTIALGVTFGVGLVPLLCVLLLSLAFSAFVGLGGVTLNLLLPKLDWTNEILVVKQSASGMLAMLLNLVAVGLLAGLYFLCLSAGLGFYLFALCATAFVLVLDLALLAFLRTRGQRIFNQL